jgi:hypothetical protein
MWQPLRFTTGWASTACYRDSFLTVAQIVQKVHLVLWNLKGDYHLHVGLPLVCTCLTNPVHTTSQPTYFRIKFKIRAIYAQIFQKSPPFLTTINFVHFVYIITLNLIEIRWNVLRRRNKRTDTHYQSPLPSLYTRNKNGSQHKCV